MWDAFAIRSPELKRSILVELYPISLFMDGLMVAAAEYDEVGQSCRPALRPVTDVMALALLNATSWETATLIALLQHSSQRSRDGASPRAHGEDTTVSGVTHPCAGGVTTVGCTPSVRHRK